MTAEVPSALSATAWDITAVDSENRRLVPMVDGFRAATISFDEHLSVAGSTGCNSFMGRCTIDDHELTMGPLATTMMMCSDDSMTQERRILRALESATSWQAEDSVLRLMGGDDVLLVARRAAPTRTSAADDP